MRCDLPGRHPLEWRPADDARVPQVREDRQLAKQLHVGRIRRERRARRSPWTSTLEVTAIGRERQAVGRLEHVTMQMSHERELALRLLPDDVGGHWGAVETAATIASTTPGSMPIYYGKIEGRVPGFRVPVSCMNLANLNPEPGTLNPLFPCPSPRPA